MKLAVLVAVVLSCLGCGQQDKQPAVVDDRRAAEKALHSAEEFERRERLALEQNERTSEAFEKTAEDFRRASKEALDRHKRKEGNKE